VLGLITYVIMAAFGAGGAVLGGLLILKFRVQEQFPQALWFGRVLGAYIWSKIARQLWANLQRAIAESKAAAG
jgi:hypothetical protein